MKKLYLSTVLCLQSTIFIYGQTTDTCRMKIGMNLFSIRTSATNPDFMQPFANVLKECDEWYGQDTTGIATTTNNSSITLFTFNTDGYPNEVPISGNGVCARMLFNTYAANSNYNYYPSGTYNVSYTGNGTLRFGGDASGADITTGSGTITVTPSNTGIIMKIVLSDVNNPIRDIKVMMPGHSFSTIFNTDFVNRLTPFNVLRFMEWNNMNTNTEVQWQNRRKPSYYTQSGSGGTMNNRGIAWEYVVELCNLMQKNCWISVPTQVDSAYIDSLATMFRDNLNPNLKIYLEYSNETSNQIWLTNYNWIDDPNNSSFTLTNHAQKTAWHFKKVFDIWDTVFLTQMPTRVVRVLGGWASNIGVGDMTTMITYMNSNGGAYDAISCDAYILPISADYGWMNTNCSTGANLSTWTQPQLIDTLIGIGRARMANKMPVLNQFNSLANGKQLVFYEGGPHITNQTTCTAVSSAIAPLQTDVKMYNLYNDWLDSLRTLSNVKLFNHFVITGAGPMGILSNIYQTTSQKYKVLTDYIDSCGILTGISENNTETNSVFIYPDPFSSQTTFQTAKPFKNASLAVYNSICQTVKHMDNLAGQTIIFHRDNLPSGLYFVRLTQDNEVIAVDKLVITD
ncbi:MAG: T9SS type A sorting domain-containing protein [Bacteroidetes bacterium]|nr:T9SS type A sorting domain-containing protein [Bacteroidota bacterium]